jgi:transposase
VIADKAYDADDRVIQPLKQAGIEAVIPPKSKRRTARNYNRELYKARHLIENFYCKGQYAHSCKNGHMTGSAEYPLIR